MFSLSPLPRTLAAAERDLAHAKIEVRKSAVRDLGRIASSTGPDRSRALAALERTLLEPGPAPVRVVAAMTLADCEATDRVGALVQAASDAEPELRQTAIMAIGELGQPDDAAAMGVVRRALSEGPPAVRFQALIAACQMDAAVAKPFVWSAVSDPDEEVRYIALRLIDEHFSAPGGPLDTALGAPLVEALQDESARVRLAAAIVLGRHGDLAAGEVLCAALTRGGAEPQDEQAAIELVAELGLTKAVPALRRRARGGFLRHPFAWNARVALARMGEAKARERIVRELSAWSWETRTLAVVAVGQARLVEARSLLERMRDSPGRADPQTVEDALELLGPPQAAG